MADKSYDLERAEPAVRTCCEKRGFSFHLDRIDQRRLVLRIDDKYNFHFDLEESESVGAETREMLESYSGPQPKALFVKSQRRIELWGDEDPGLDYLNLSLFLVEEFQQEGVLIFDQAAGDFV